MRGLVAAALGPEPAQHVAIQPQGDLLAASFNGNIYRCKPGGSGLVDLPGSPAGTSTQWSGTRRSLPLAVRTWRASGPGPTSRVTSGIAFLYCERCRLKFGPQILGGLLLLCTGCETAGLQSFFSNDKFDAERLAAN